MTTTEQTILSELRALRREVAELRGADVPSDGMVGVGYVARLFGCSAYSARHGKAGTQHVRWLSRRPLRCTRAEAHAALRRWAESKQRGPTLVRRKRAA